MDVWRRRAVASAPDHMDELPARGRYHPFEDIPEAARLDDGEPAHLTDAESARTIVEVATVLWQSGSVFTSSLADQEMLRESARARAGEQQGDGDDLHARRRRRARADHPAGVPLPHRRERRYAIAYRAPRLTQCSCQLLS